MVLYSLGETLWGIRINDLLGELPTPGNTALYFSTIITGGNLGFFIGTSVGSTLYQVLGPAVLFGGLIVVGVIAGYRLRIRSPRTAGGSS